MKLKINWNMPSIALVFTTVSAAHILSGFLPLHLLPDVWKESGGRVVVLKDKELHLIRV